MHSAIISGVLMSHMMKAHSDETAFMIAFEASAE